MSVVIVGGNDRMARQYIDVCDKYNCKAKIFTQLPGNFRAHIGTPDLIVLFTSTVSHIMAKSAVQTAKKYDIKIARSHTSSSSALQNILSKYCD